MAGLTIRASTAMKFEVLADGAFIGYTMLEFGDPPMGVAHGAFLPVPAYEKVRQRIMESYANSPTIELTVRLRGAEHPIPCVAVGILDTEHGPPHLEILGVPYPDYEIVFPQHVQRYRAKFPGPVAEP